MWSKLSSNQPADGHRAKVFGRGHAGQMRQRRIGWVERQRHETLEPASDVLQLPQADEVVDAVFDRLDMPKQHRGIAPQPEFMGPYDARRARSPRRLCGDRFQCVLPVRRSRPPPPGRLPSPASIMSRSTASAERLASRANQSISNRSPRLEVQHRVGRMDLVDDA